MEQFAGAGLGLVIGSLIGLTVGIGMFLLRRYAWNVAVGLGWVAVAGVAYGILFAIGLLMRTAGQGGDGAMSGALLLIGVAVGLFVLSAGAAVLGYFQGFRYGKPLLSSFVAALPDLPLLAGAFLVFLNLAVTPLEKKTTDVWWQQELARRKEREAQKEAIPEEYRHITSRELNAHAELQSQLAKSGRSVSPLVPRDVEDKIRAYEYEMIKPEPIPDRSGYMKAREMRGTFVLAMAATWFVAAGAASLLSLRRSAA